MELAAEFTSEGALFVTCCLEVDVRSQGDSMDDALANRKGPSVPTSRTRTNPSNWTIRLSARSTFCVNPPNSGRHDVGPFSSSTRSMTKEGR